MSNSLCLRNFFEFSWSFIVDHFEDFLNRILDSINLLHCQLVFFNISLILLFILLNLLFKLFLLFLLIRITPKSLVFILVNLSSKYCDLLIKLFRFFLKLIHKSVQRKVSFFSLDKILHKFVKIFDFRLFNYFIKHLCILFHFLFRDQADNLIIDFSFLNPFFLDSCKLLLLSLCRKIFLLKFNLFLFLLFQSFLLCSLLKDFIINILHVFVKLSLLLFSLFDQISKFFRCLLSIRISVVCNINDQCTFILLIL